jgi:hypothetical protein
VPHAGRTVVEPSAFDDFAFDEAFENALPLEPEAPTPEPVAVEAPPDPATGGIAYITVTDAAGRVLFQRAATQNEVQDALRSADTAASEGEAAMDRIAHDRLEPEITGPVIPSFADPEFPFEGDLP